MPSSIDKRIVEMDFDNQRFEKNVGQSISTLDKFKNALNLSDAAKGFNELEKQVNSFDLSGLEKSISNIERRFSTLGIVGATVVSNLTNKVINKIDGMTSSVIGLAKTGGINRALNLEHANFMLEGLLKDSGKVAEIINGPVNNAVSGTAYGLDAAANAAAQFVASGVEDMDKLESALTGISGVAAMTGAQYEDIAQIFTTVAGQGKVMTMQFRQIESRGLNAAAAVGEYLGKTEAEVRDMVTKGQIDFETFSEAMNKAFGDQAKKANDTFTGAMSNVKAALSRLGAKIATPTLEELRKTFVDLIDVVNNISKALDPFINVVNNFINTIFRDIRDVLEQTDKLNEIVSNIVETMGYALYDILEFIRPISEALGDIIPKPSLDGVIGFTEKVKDLVSKLTLSEEASYNLRRAFRGVFAIFDILSQVITGLIRAFAPGISTVSDFGGKILEVVGNIGDYIYVIDQVLKKNDVFVQLFKIAGEKIGNAVSFVSDKVKLLIGILKNFSSTHINLPDGGKIFTNLVEAFKKNEAPLTKFGNAFKLIFGGLANVIGEFSPLLKSFAGMVGRGFGEIANGFEKVFSGGGFSTLLSLVNSGLLVGIGVTIAKFIRDITRNVEAGTKIFKKISGFIGTATGTMKAMKQSFQADILIKAAQAIAILAGSLVALSLVNPEDLTRSLIAITIMFGELMGVLYLFTKISDSLKSDLSLMAGALSFAAIGASIFIIASALKMLSGIDSGALEEALGIVTALMLELLGVAVVLGNWGGKMEVGALGLIAFALSIKIIGSALQDIGSIDLETLQKGLVGMTIAIVELAGAAMLIGQSDFGASAGVGILLMAASLKVIGSAIAQIGSLQPEVLSTGLKAIAIALLEIGVFMAAMGEASGLLSTAAAIGILALALIGIANAVSAFGSMGLEELAKGLGSVAVILIELSAALMILGEDAVGTLAAAAAILVMSISLNALIPVLLVLSNMDLPQLGTALLGLAGTLAILAGAGFLFGSFAGVMLLGAAAITALGVATLVSAAGMAASSIAIGLLVTALQGLTELGWVELLSCIGKLAVTFVVLGVAAVALAPMGAILLTIAAALIGVGVAANLLAAAVSVCAIGLALMATAIQKFENISWDTIAKGLVVLLGALLGLGLAAAVLSPLAPVILAIGAGVALLGAGALMASAALLAFGVAIDVLGPKIASLANSIIEFASNAWNYISNALTQIWNGLLDFANGLLTFVGNILSSVLKGIVGGAGNILKILVDLGGEMLKALGVPEDWVNAATNFIKGLIDGLTAGIKGVIDKVGEIGKGMIDKIKDVLKIHSPSEEGKGIGGLFDEGIIEGVKGLKDQVVASVADVGVGMKVQAQDDANDVKSIWDELANYGKSISASQKQAAEAEDKKRGDMRGYNNIDALTRAGQAGQIHLVHKNTEAVKENTDAISSNTGARGGGSKAKKEDTKKTEENTKALAENTSTLGESTEALGDNTDAQAEWEQQIRDEAEKIEIVTEKYKTYLDTFMYTDPFKVAKNLTKSLSKYWTSEGTAITSVTKSLTSSIKTIDKQAVAFKDTGKYAGKLSQDLYSSSKKIEKQVEKTGKTIAKVMGNTSKIFYKTGNSVSKMVITTTKNVKNLGKRFKEAQKFIKDFNSDITNTDSSEAFITNLRNIEKYFGGNKLKQMPKKVKTYLEGITNELSELNNSMNILGKNIDGVGNILSKKSKSTVYVTDAFLALGASLYDGSDAANEYATEYAKLMYMMENGLDVEEEASEKFQSYISRIKEALVEYRTSIRDNLAGSMDIWSEFDKNLLDESVDLIHNIESQIAGYQEWGNGLMELSKRGFDSGIIKMLTEEGVSSFGKMQKLLEMSREDLALFTVDYQMSQKVIEDATDTAMAAVANAQTRASLRAAAAQGDKTAKAQLKQSKKTKEELQNDAKAVADYQAKYRKMNEKEEKAYLKTLTKEEKKAYKKQLKAAKKQQDELEKLADQARVKRAEEERVQGILDSIKTFEDYLSVMYKYENDASAMTKITESMNKAFEPLNDAIALTGKSTDEAAESMLAFAETLDATGEEGLNYFEEMSKRIENFGKGVRDAIKDVNILSTEFGKAEKVTWETVYNNMLSNLAGNDLAVDEINKLRNKGYNSLVIQKVMDIYKSNQAEGLEYLKLLNSLEGEYIQFLNEGLNIYENDQDTIENVTKSLATNLAPTKKSLETAVNNAKTAADEAFNYQQQKAVALNDAKTKLDAEYANLQTLQNKKNQEERERATLALYQSSKKLTKKQEQDYISLLKKYGGTYKGVTYAVMSNLNSIDAQIANSKNSVTLLEQTFANAQREYAEALNNTSKKQKLLADAQKKLNDYLAEMEEASKKIKKDKEVLKWYNATITSVEALRDALGSLSKETAEYAKLIESINAIKVHFTVEEAIFDDNFDSIKQMAEKSNPFSIWEDGLYKFGESISDTFGSIEESLVEFRKSLDDTYKSSADFFSKFNRFSDEDNPLGLSSFINNAADNIRALTEYGDMLIAVTDRGLNKDLVTKLASEGATQSNYELLHAIYNATDQELADYNELWKKYNDAIETVSSMAMAAIVASWSDAGKAIQDSLISSFGDGLPEKLEDVGYEASAMVITGIKDGLTNAMPTIISSVEKSASTSTIATTLGNEVGKSINEGMAKAISVSVTDTVNAAVEKFKMAVDFVNLYVQETLSTDYTITIHVDTTEFDDAIARMNNAISGINATANQTSSNVVTSMANQASASTPASTSTVTNNNVTLQQNNYSPKALDQVDIYRQTKQLTNMVNTRFNLANG